MKERKPLAVGDRVAYYNCARQTGVICLVVSPESVRIEGDDGFKMYVHPKQVRRLVRKPKERRWSEREIAEAWDKTSAQTPMFSSNTLSSTFQLLRKNLGIGDE